MGRHFRSSHVVRRAGSYDARHPACATVFRSHADGGRPSVNCTILFVSMAQADAPPETTLNNDQPMRSRPERLRCALR